MAERPVVAAVRCQEYAQVEAALQRTVELLGGMEQFVRPGMRVALKPNLMRAAAPERATATHPAVVAAIVRFVQEAGSTPVIVESPGGPFSRAWLRAVYDSTGMTRVAAETGAELSYDTSVRQVPFPEGQLLKRIDIIDALLQADVVINLAKLKTHNLTRLTLAVKNCFGAVPGTVKIGYHAKLQDAMTFAKGLLDVACCVRPVLSVIDGVLAMDGNGPSGGDPFPANVLLASADMVAVDVAATALVGWDPLTVTTTRAAVEWGLSSGRVEDLEWRGDTLETLRLEGFRGGSAAAVDPGLLPRGLRGRLRRLIAARGANGRRLGEGDLPREVVDAGTVPSAFRRWALRQLVVNPYAGRRCNGCGHCVRHCPVRAIRLVDGRAHMDHNACIRCYCCHELCPQLAVELRRGWVGRLLYGT